MQKLMTAALAGMVLAGGSVQAEGFFGRLRGLSRDRDREQALTIEVEQQRAFGAEQRAFGVEQQRAFSRPAPIRLNVTREQFQQSSTPFGRTTSKYSSSYVSTEPTLAEPMPDLPALSGTYREPTPATTNYQSYPTYPSQEPTNVYPSAPAPIQGTYPQGTYPSPGDGVTLGYQTPVMRELYPFVKVEDRHKVHPHAVPIIVAAPDPCHRGCEVAVEICVPPCDPAVVKCRRNGTKIEYDFGKYEVELKIRRDYVVVDYDW